MQTDYVQRFLFEELDIRGRLLCLTGAWQRMLDGRDYPEDIASLLGHTTALNPLPGADQKGAGRVTLQVQGSGPVRLLVADCTAELRIRGMAHYRKEGLRKTNERNLLGDGRLSMTLEDLQSGRFYQSLVPLEGNTLQQIFEHYLSKPDHLPAYLRLNADDHAPSGRLLEKRPNPHRRDAPARRPAPALASKAGPQPITPRPAHEAKAPEAPKPDPDKELAARVKKALEGEAKIQAAAIDVTAADGKVTLWGTAATAAERKRAESVASKVDGVRSVDNEIKVVKGS